MPLVAHAPSRSIDSCRLVEVIDGGSPRSDAHTPSSSVADAPVRAAKRCSSASSHRDSVELGLKPIDGHPFDHLIGFRSPPRLVGRRCRRPRHGSADGGRRRYAPRRSTPGRRVRTTHLVARTGDAASVMRFDDDEPIVQRHPDVHRRPDADRAGIARRHRRRPAARARPAERAAPGHHGRAVGRLLARRGALPTTTRASSTAGTGRPWRPVTHCSRSCPSWASRATPACTPRCATGPSSTSTGPAATSPIRSPGASC